jgi:hypothetical protein
LTLANRLGCERKAIADSIKRLGDLGWIVSQAQWQWNEKTKRRTRSIGKTLGLSVNLDKLPQAKDKTEHSRPSAEAVSLAAQHTAYLIKLGKSVRQHKNFSRQQEYAAQRLIDELGSFEEAAAVVSFAWDNERFKNSAQKSLYELRTRLSTIKRAYEVAQSVTA